MKKLMLFVAVIAVAGGAFVFTRTSPAPAAPPAAAMPPTEVSVVTIAPRPISFTKDLPGRTASFKVAEIRPQVSGLITKRLFEEGSEVTEGQQLFQIDPATYQAEFDSAQADLMKAQAGLKTAQARYNRNAQLVKSGIASKQSFDDVQASLDQGKADVAIAKATVARAKINLDFTKVFSPISGRIGKSLVTEGALVTANQAAALATVQQFDPIYVDVTQSSTELMDLRRQLSSEDVAVKTPVTLLLDGNEKTYEQTGTLQFSDVTVDQTTGSVQMRVLFPNPNHELLPGLFVRARIGQAREDNAITVPQKATARKADGSVTVWLVGEGDKVALQPIKVTQTVGDQWLVTEGLKAGDRVITQGIQKVAPGAVVKPVEASGDKVAPSQAEK